MPERGSSSALAASPAHHVILPAASRPLPGPDTLDHVLACPIAQLIVAGRSGSMLIHAYLDGHPELLHVPHTFKFFDFVAANPDLLELDAATLCRRFVESPLTPSLFDSAKSVLIGGRLGDGMNIYVEVDRRRFTDAFASLMHGAAFTYRSVFCGLVAAYGWCVGQDPREAKVLLHHLHHGDWLFPDVLIDRGNVPDSASVDALAVLRPTRILQALRNPYETFLSTVGFARKHQLSEAEVVNIQEQFVRILAQDWFRWRLVQRIDGWCHTIRLEDLRKDPVAEMRRCAAALGIDPNAPTLGELTLYGQAWMGDIYTAPTKTIHAPAQRGHISWQDRAYLDDLLGGWIADAGYPRSSTATAANALMRASVLVPSSTVFGGGSTAVERWRAAAATTMDRQRFVRRFSAAKRAAGLNT